MPDFIRALRTSKTAESITLAFEFLILTAARTSEVLGARWEKIDVQARTWTIPAARIKAGREHRVALSDRCLELVDRARHIGNGGVFVFPGRSPASPLAFLMLLRRMGTNDVTAHGFRSAFRDWAAERTSFLRVVCEAALAHVVKDKAEAAYFRSDLFQLHRSLMETWSAYATTEGADVVVLRA